MAVWVCSVHESVGVAMCVAVWVCSVHDSVGVAMCVAVWVCSVHESVGVAMCVAVWVCSVHDSVGVAMCVAVWVWSVVTATMHTGVIMLIHVLYQYPTTITTWASPPHSMSTMCCYLNPVCTHLQCGCSHSASTKTAKQEPCTVSTHYHVMYVYLWFSHSHVSAGTCRCCVV